jgi:hypothetical protein
MELSDSLRPYITVVSVRFTVRPWLRWTRSEAGPPESRTQCFRACQGSSTPPGACTPCHNGVPAVAFRVFGARRHLGLARFRGSIPCLHVPLSTLHGPRYRGSRMTRGQRGWLDLRCWRLALLHTVPVCLGTPERQASAAGSCSAIRLCRRIADYGVCVAGGSGAPKGASTTLTHAQTPCQSRSERWPTNTGCVEGGSVAKKLRKTDGTRKPACTQSCNT